MQPRTTPDSDGELFRARLEQVLDPTHPLVRLAGKIDWERVERRVATCYTDEGRPGLSPRLMVGLHYLKHAFDESDESVCERWIENPYWQFFCGEQFFRHELPIDPSSMTRWRQRVGVKLFDDLLALTLNLAVGLKQARPAEFREVAVDTTVQPKAIAYPTDARLYDTARRKLVEAARREGVKLRQSYARKGPEAVRRAGRYAHAKQFRRARRMRKTLRNYLGRVIREYERHGETRLSQATRELLDRCRRLHRQRTHDAHKLYALHAPEVVCIAKGKARQRYEFGSKVGVVTSLKKGTSGGWVLSALSFWPNPYDGHTLATNVAHAACRSGVKVELAAVDKGYRGHNAALLDVEVLMPGTRSRSRTACGRLSRSLRKKLRRRNSIEPVIGHLKHDHRMGRCHLKGRLGDQLNALGSALGFNFRKLLAGIKADAACARLMVACQPSVIPRIASDQRQSSTVAA